MSDVEALRQKLEAFHNIGEEFVRLVYSLPEGWQSNHIALRRTLEETIADLGARGRRLLSKRGDAAQLREFENLHARYRRLVSLHQANWPIFNLNPKDPAYRRSMADVGVTYRDFVKALDDICR